MAVLQVIQGLTPGLEFEIVPPRAVLGRHPECNIILDVGAISRQHAQISLMGDDYFVEDLHSRNGTFVNGQEIKEPRKLITGDKVKICDLLFSFVDRKSPPPTVELLSRTVDDSKLARTVLVDDNGESNSTIMSSVNVSTDMRTARINVNPEAKLRALIEISQNLSRALSVDEVLPKLLDSLFKIFIQADRGFIVLRTSPEGPLIPKAVRHRRADNDETIRISKTIVNQAMTSKQAILSADAATDTRFEMSQSIADFRIRSMMCAPLMDGEGTAIGVLQVDTLDQRSRFTQDDLDVLAGVASQAAFAIDNAQLHERDVRQRGMQRDLEMAHRVQRGLLPSAPPQVAGYHFFDFYEAANQVGGDFYDYIPLMNGRLGVVLADVSGKGVSAALLMAKLSADVRYCLASEPDAAKAVNRINSSFCQAGWEDRFVTAVFAVLDPIKNEVTVVNAGHMPPFLRSQAGSVSAIGGDLAGIPLGIYADYTYEPFTVDFAPGSFLTLFTDGISEAMNTANELYGMQRLESQVGNQAANVSELGRRILDDVKRFVGGRAQSDDMCLACFGRI